MAYSDRPLFDSKPNAVRRDSTPKSDDLLKLDAAKARKEAILADKHEFQLAIEKGLYVPREVIQQAAATLLSALAQGLRSVSDTLERKGIPTEVCIEVDTAINAALAETGKKLALIGGVEEG